MPSLTITEPHPTVPKNSYTHSGRGGAGNYFRAPTTTPSSGVATKPSTMSHTTTSRFYSGRGGAGNAHVAAAKPVLSFDEEFTHKSHIEQKPVGYVGRGGAGNVYGSGPGFGTGSRKGSDASSQHSSSSSGSSSRLSNIWSRISHRH